MYQRVMQPLRIVIQWAFMLYLAYLGVLLFRFALHFRSGGTAPYVPRPVGIEGFLPISALLSLRGWFDSGTINDIHPAGLVVLLAVLASSWLLKRSFCSWVCPVGTLSELLWKTGFRYFRRNVRPPRWLDMVLRGVKYLLLLFFLWTIMVAMTPEQVATFIVSDYNKLADVRLMDFFLHLSGIPLIVISLLMLAALPLRNPFCRYLCPYGALTGLVSMLSPVKVTRVSQTCVTCGACTQVCPSYIPVMHRERVHSEECIGCWRCISHCRAEGALEMRLTGTRVAINGFMFAALVVGIFWGGSALGKWTGHWHTSIPQEEYRRLLGP